MSRLTRFWSRFFLKASPLRTYAETLLLFVLLLLFTVVVYESKVDEMIGSALLFFVNPCSSLYYSVRLRTPAGRWYRRIGLDLLWILIPTLLFNPILWLMTHMSLLGVYGYGSINAVMLLLLAFPYIFSGWNSRHPVVELSAAAPSHLVAGD
jgi:hypothetical protein